jgi:hypothetical protein
VDTLQTKRKELEERIVQIILDEIEKNTLTIDQAKEITGFWLSRISTLTTEESLTNFVDELAAKWPIFNTLVMIEQNKIRRGEEEKVAENVVSLVRDGKIEEAVSLAKSANN